jgi:hypothetical protein
MMLAGNHSWRPAVLQRMSSMIEVDCGTLGSTFCLAVFAEVREMYVDSLCWVLKRRREFLLGGFNLEFMRVWQPDSRVFRHPEPLLLISRISYSGL